MLKKVLLEQINNDNHYTVPRYVFSYAKKKNLNINSLILLIYFINKKNKDIFDYKKIIEDLSFSEKELLDAISDLKERKILSIIMEKNESGILEEKVDITLFYEIIFSEFLNEEEIKISEENLYDEFERGFGRTLSPMEYDIINSWLEQNIDKNLIKEALKETVYNGVNNLRYVDKILFEWSKKGIKKASDIRDTLKRQEEEKKEENFEYDWLNE